MELKVIAYARNGHTDKFGIPRQSREESPIVTRIVLEPEYSIPEALRGIEGFSHLWLLWGFDKGERLKAKGERGEWSPTVRPPRLGGNKRMGVFATRSPFRPNPIGLTSVRLLKVKAKGERLEAKGKGQIELLVTGADLLDGTPIYDIKPYLSYSDSHPEAVDGFAADYSGYRLSVSGERLADVPEEIRRDIAYILSQDPRPGYQQDAERVYRMDYAGWTISFRVADGTVLIEKAEKM